MRSRTVADAGEAPRWSLLEALAMLSVTLAAFVGKEVVLALAPVRALPVGALVLVRAAVLAGYYAVQLAALRWLAARHQSTVRELLVGPSERQPSRGSVLWAAAAVLVGTRAFAVAYGVVMRSVGVLPDSSALLETFGAEPAGLVLAASLVVLVGPVVEEMVFRGVLLRGLEGRFGAPLAIVVQAFLFAALHRSAWLFVPMAALGAALGWLAQRSRSLVPAVLVHASYNAVTVFAAFALRG